MLEGRNFGKLIVRVEQASDGERAPTASELVDRIKATGLRVEEPAQVRPALEQALESDGPVLVDVVTDPNLLSMPPKATIQQANGFALA
jgi:pyruvate dehydrogenase (quinone)